MNTQEITHAETTFVRRRSNGVGLCFILVCLLSFNFKSIKRFFIYLFHFSSVIDLRNTSSSEISDDFIIDRLNVIAPEKTNKNFLYKLTGLSKKTFNKRFEGYFARNGLTNKRKFTLKEIYYVFKYWQGEGRWTKPKAVSKREVAEVMFNGDYKVLADEFSIFCKTYLKHQYKEYDKFSPSEIKAFSRHIDFDDQDKIDTLLQGNKFEINTRWAIAIYVFLKSIENKWD